VSEDIDFLIERIEDEYGAGTMPAGYGDAGVELPPLLVTDRSGDEHDAGEGLTGGGGAGSADQTHTADLTDTNVVSIAPAEETSTPIGTEYDHRVERTVGVRIEAVHHSQWGYIDPHGEQGLPWGALKRCVRRAILRARTYPATGTPDISYTHLRLANETDQSANYGDYYRADLDVVFDGFETLPTPGL